MKHLKLMSFAVLAIFLTFTSFAGAQSISPAQSIPVDPQITIGQLQNGLRYYVRVNPKPEKRAELRLVVKAGSVLEDDNQQGMAHFVEHMAFNGTRHFPKNDMIQFIESLGMRFGPDLNATTSFDETVYMLQVPTDKTEVMDKALLILEDWAHHIAFDPAEIDKERLVITEEWRLRRGAGARMTDKLIPIILKGSRYADRLPIGKVEVIQNFDADALKKFYLDWYRPDLMAVVAVGDFDKTAVENLIKSHFGSIPMPQPAKERPTYEVPDHTGVVYAIMTDKEMTSTTIAIENILPAPKQDSLDVYRQHIVDRMFSNMLSARFFEMTQKPNAPFLGARVGRGSFIAHTKETAALNALVQENGIETGLDALLTEVDRIERFGFTATELDRQRQNILRSYERMATEDINRQSGSRAAEYIRNFLQDESLPGAELELAMHRRFLPEITLNEINKLTGEWFANHNRIVTVIAPEKAGLIIPDEAKLAAVIKAAHGKELTPYVDTLASGALLDPLPQPGTIVKTATKDALGITEWELSNGVKVVLKPTTLREDEIVFRAFSPGGTSLASDKEYIAANSATQVLGVGGLGQFNSVNLQKVLTGKEANANVFIGELEEGLTGGGSRKDIETMFQLIYLRFTQPRADATAFSVLTTQARTALANQAATPAFAFNQALTTILGQNHPRRRITTAATIDEWNLDQSLAFYKNRFADASDFTFVFVGSFDPPAIKPFIERYLGGLPSIHRNETWKDIGAKPPTGVIEKKVEKGIEPMSQTVILFTGPFEYDPEHRTALRAMTQILQTRLREIVREELGGTYSVTVGSGGTKTPNPEYQVAIQFGSDPQRTDDLVKHIFSEIETFKAGGPTEKQLNDEKEALQREFQTSSEQNGYLLTQISGRYQLGEDVAGIWDAPGLYRKLDAAMIQQAAKTYLNMNNYVKVSLFPEK